MILIIIILSSLCSGLITAFLWLQYRSNKIIKDMSDFIEFQNDYISKLENN